jgi:hypothetical protein
MPEKKKKEIWKKNQKKRDESISESQKKLFKIS